MKNLKKQSSQKNISLKYSSDTDLVGVLFEACENKIDDLSVLSSHTMLSRAKKNYNRSYENLLKSIKNLPPHFNNMREAIINALDEYLLSENLVNNYECEFFYRNGFSDGMNIIIQGKNKH